MRSREEVDGLMRRAVAAYKSGSPLPTIADHLGVTVGYVNYLMRRAAVNRTRGAGRKQSVAGAARVELTGRAVDAYLSGASVPMVAKSLGRGEDLIRQLLREARVDERDCTDRIEHWG